MAKGYAMERWQGKKGSNVFYKISNSSNAQKQGVRERVYEVSNPKTRSQALQRMKVRAAQNFYNTLAPILNRAMQGVKYGGMTRNEFMKYALSMSSSPAVDKGSSVAIPGNYLLSKGSLPAFAVSDEPNFNLVKAPWAGDFDIQGSLTAANVADICANGAVQEGDQITIIMYDHNLQPFYVSFLIKVGEVLPTLNSYTIELVGNESLLVINGLLDPIAAIAVILSRKSGNKYERSTAYLAINEESTAIKQAYSTQAINAALATYQKSVSVNGESTDWPVEPEEDGQGTGSFSISAPYTISGLTGAKAGLNGRKTLVYENLNTGDKTSVAVSNGYLVDYTTRQVLMYQEAGVHVGLKPSDVPELANLPTSEINSGSSI